jgi:hypothetical protein
MDWSMNMSSEDDEDSSRVQMLDEEKDRQRCGEALFILK